MAEEGSTSVVRFYHEQRNVLLEKVDKQMFQFRVQQDSFI